MDEVQRPMVQLGDSTKKYYTMQLKAAARVEFKIFHINNKGSELKQY